MPNIKSRIDHNAFCKQLGEITLIWSIVDQELDLWGFIFFAQLGGNKIREVLPKGTANRAKYLKECLHKFPVLAPLCDGAIALVIRATNVSKSRDDLVHGVVQSLKTADGNYKLHKFDHSADGLGYREVQMSEARLKTIIDDCLRLGDDVRAMSARIEKLLPPA